MMKLRGISNRVVTKESLSTACVADEKGGKKKTRMKGKGSSSLPLIAPFIPPLLCLIQSSQRW